MGWAVALPSRGHAHDAVHQWPPARGGQNGSVAIPSRLAGITGAGTIDAAGVFPPGDGAWGGIRGITPYAPWWDWSKALFGRLLAAVNTRDSLYVRHYVPNVVPVVTFSPPNPATTNRTTNTVDQAGPLGAISPIPHNWRRVEVTFRREYDTRIYADYLPREQIQRSKIHRKQIAGPRMARPVFSQLTQLATTTSYGQQTPVRAPASVGEAGAPSTAPAPDQIGRFGPGWNKV